MAAPQQLRRSRHLAPALLLGAMLCSAAPDRAAEPNPSWIETLAIDSVRSHAEFDVRAMLLFSVHGRFGAVRGTVAIDQFRSTAKVDAEIDADAVRMRNSDYEDWIKSDEFFDVKHYPNIHFVSEPIALERMNRGGEIDGLLTVRGISQPVRFTLKASTCPGAAARSCPAEAEGTIRRGDFGMRSHRLTLSDKVELHFAVFAVAESDAQDAPP